MKQKNAVIILVALLLSLDGIRKQCYSGLEIARELSRDSGIDLISLSKTLSLAMVPRLVKPQRRLTIGRILLLLLCVH